MLVKCVVRPSIKVLFAALPRHQLVSLTEFPFVVGIGFCVCVCANVLVSRTNATLNQLWVGFL